MTNHYTDVCEATIESLRKTIEHQAAQIEMMREALEQLLDDMGLEGHRVWEATKKQAILSLSTTPDQALEQFAAKVREQCAKVCENEYPYTVFHTDQRAAINCAAAIRAITETPK